MEGEKLAPKAKAVYHAVIALFAEGADLNSLTVAEIAEKAGIGKGTVYEYFKNKEEMIAGALFYQMKESCENLYEELGREKNMYDKMDKILSNMEKEMTEISFFIRALYVMLDNSSISGRLRELWCAKGKKEVPVVDLMRRVIDDEIGTEEGVGEEDRDYLVMTVLSRLACFAIYQFGTGERLSVDKKTMRERICRDACRDVENAKSFCR